MNMPAPAANSDPEQLAKSTTQGYAPGMRKFTVTLISLTAAVTAALTITGSATIDTRSETAAVVGVEPKTTGPGDDSHAGHDHGPVAGPGSAQASAPAESAEAVGVYRWRHRVITWRLRTPAWTWSAAGQRQSIALAMAVWDSASSRITLRQTSGPADIENPLRQSNLSAALIRPTVPSATASSNGRCR